MLLYCSKGLKMAGIEQIGRDAMMYCQILGQARCGSELRADTLSGSGDFEKVCGQLNGAGDFSEIVVADNEEGDLGILGGRLGMVGAGRFSGLGRGNMSAGLLGDDEDEDGETTEVIADGKLITYSASGVILSVVDAPETSEQEPDDIDESPNEADDFVVPFQSGQVMELALVPEDGQYEKLMDELFIRFDNENFQTQRIDEQITERRYSAVFERMLSAYHQMSGESSTIFAG